MSGLILAAGVMIAGDMSEPMDGLDSEIARWQLSHQFVERGYLLAKRYRESIPVLVALDPRLPEAAMWDDAAIRFRVWDELDNVVRLRQASAIPRLRAALGDEAWVLRRLPPPTPWGYGLVDWE